MKRNIKKPLLFALGIFLLLIAALFWPTKHEAEAKIGPREQVLRAHRYNMSPEQTEQFVKAILPRLGWVLMHQDRNVFMARTPGFVLGQNCRVEITMQNTQMGEAAFVEIRSESFQGMFDTGINQKNIQMLQAAMDEKLPLSP
jgi:uncharacterized protein (DUF1499 family)